LLALAIGAGVVVAASLVMRAGGDQTSGSRQSPNDALNEETLIPTIVPVSPESDSSYPRTVPGRQGETNLAAEGDAHGGHWRLYSILSLNEQGALFECLGFERSEDAADEDASSICTTETRPPTQVAVGWVRGFVYGDAWAGFSQPLGRVVATLADGSTAEAAINPPKPAGFPRGSYAIVLPSLDDVPIRVDVFDSNGKLFASGDAASKPTPLATELAFPA
jgi:hypothetical protein